MRINVYRCDCCKKEFKVPANENPTRVRVKEGCCKNIDPDIMRREICSNCASILYTVLDNIKEFENLAEKVLQDEMERGLT